jgi:phosphonoacetate hydrolase
MAVSVSSACPSWCVSAPLDPGWLAAHPRLRNYDIFDAALNAVVA